MNKEGKCPSHNADFSGHSETKHFKPTSAHTWDSEADPDRASVVVSFFSETKIHIIKYHFVDTNIHTSKKK